MDQRRVIWFAIAFSTVIYAVIAYIEAPTPAGPLEGALRNTTVLGLYGVAIAAFVTAFAVRAMLRDAPSRTRLVVSLAVFEACAIFGLLAAFLQRDWRLYLAPWALALIGFFASWPSGEPETATTSPASSRTRS